MIFQKRVLDQHCLNLKVLSQLEYSSGKSELFCSLLNQNTDRILQHCTLVPAGHRCSATKGVYVHSQKPCF